MVNKGYVLVSSCVPCIPHFGSQAFSSVHICLSGGQALTFECHSNLPSEHHADLLGHLKYTQKKKKNTMTHNRNYSKKHNKI